MLDILFSHVNTPLTILLGLLILYWIVSVISGLDFDMDFDVDVDVDLDVDLDTDLDVDQAMGQELDFGDVSNTEINKEDILEKRYPRKLKWWQIVLIHFNFVGLPFMFTFTCWIFFWWMGTTVATILTSSYNSGFGFIWFFIALIPSLYITKLFTTPFKSFFKNLNKDGDQPIDFVGRVGVINSNIEDSKIGSAEFTIDKSPYRLNVQSFEGEKIEYGTTVLVIKESKEKDVYLVQKYKSEY
jgi:hypothetical protein